MRSIESALLFDHLDPWATNNYPKPHYFSEQTHVHVRYAVARSSACRLSICNAREPYSGGGNFRQYS